MTPWGLSLANSRIKSLILFFNSLYLRSHSAICSSVLASILSISSLKTSNAYFDSFASSAIFYLSIALLNIQKLTFTNAIRKFIQSIIKLFFFHFLNLVQLPCLRIIFFVEEDQVITHLSSPIVQFSPFGICLFLHLYQFLIECIHVLFYFPETFLIGFETKMACGVL